MKKATLILCVAGLLVGCTPHAHVGDRVLLRKRHSEDPLIDGHVIAVTSGIEDDADRVFLSETNKWYTVSNLESPFYEIQIVKDTSTPTFVPEPAVDFHSKSVGTYETPATKKWDEPTPTPSVATTYPKDNGFK